MKQSIVLIALVVSDYDEALRFYVGKLGFTLIEDTYLAAEDKRWVIVSPPQSTGTHLLLARASTDEQRARVGNQTGGRVFLFLYTDDFWRDFHAYQASGVTFLREPKEEPYGTVAVFQDLYGNQWDLLQPNEIPISKPPSPQAWETTDFYSGGLHLCRGRAAILAAAEGILPEANPWRIVPTPWRICPKIPFGSGRMPSQAGETPCPRPSPPAFTSAFAWRERRSAAHRNACGKTSPLPPPAPASV